MELPIISFETAKLAQEKGFELFTNGWFNRKGSYLGRVDINEDGEQIYYGSGMYSPDTAIQVSKEEYQEAVKIKTPATTQEILCKWLREEHYIQVAIKSSTKNEKGEWIDWHWTINSQHSLDHRDGFETYEKAMEAGLVIALASIES